MMRSLATIFVVLLSCANTAQDPAAEQRETWSKEQLPNNPFLNPLKIPSEKELGAQAFAHEPTER